MKSKSLIIVTAMICVAIATVHAQAGILDNTFGSGGIDTTVISAPYHYDYGQSVAIQTDGKIVVAGYTAINDSVTAFALVRYNTNGGLDNTFGSGGRVTTSFTDEDEAYSIALQSDGKIVAAGYSSVVSKNAYQLAVARYNTDGSLDHSFGTGGKMTASFSQGNNLMRSLAIQPDGKIIIGGASVQDIVSGLQSFAIVRLNSDASFDNTFGSGGKVFTLVSDGGLSVDNNGKSVAIQADGKIILAGNAIITNGHYQFTLIRYNSNGNRDSTFGTNGIVIAASGNSEDNSAEAVAIQTDGKIVAGGDLGNNFALIRFNNDGTLDNNFGTNGRAALINTGGAASSGEAITIQPNGKILMTGSISIANHASSLAVVRYEVNGSPDNTFGTGGLVSTAITTADAGSAIALQPDGKIVVAGTSIYDTAATYSYLTVARYGGTAAGLATMPGQMDAMIYPNPTQDRIEIGIEAGATYALNISDMSGRLIHEQILKGQDNSVDMLKFAKGAYIFRLTDRSSNTQIIRKVINE